MKQNVYDYSFELRRKRSRSISFVVTLLLSVILLMVLLINFVIFSVHVNSDSMETDIAKGSAVFVTPLVRTPKRGDVVYISRLDNYSPLKLESIMNSFVQFFTAQKYYPFGYTNAMTGKPMLRRVLGLPGDTIYMKDYVLYISPAGQDKVLTEFELWTKPYNIHIYSIPAEWNGMGACGDMEKITLNEGEYFVLADNRIEGTDSRVWGTIPASKIKGKVIFEYFPFNHLHLF